MGRRKAPITADSRFFLGSFLDEELFIKWHNYIDTHNDVTASLHIREAIRRYIDDDATPLRVVYEEELKTLRIETFAALQQFLSEWAKDKVAEIDNK